MFLHLQTLRRHVSRPVAAGVSLSAVHIFYIFAGEIASPISKLTFKVAPPPSCCRGNFHSFFMTLFTGRGRHHSSSRGGGAWGQCCHVEQLRLQPSWDISLYTAPLGFSVLRLSIRSPAVAEERASFLDRRHIARVHSRTSMATGFFASIFLLWPFGFIWNLLSTTNALCHLPSSLRQPQLSPSRAIPKMFLSVCPDVHDRMFSVVICASPRARGRLLAIHEQPREA